MSRPFPEVLQQIVVLNSQALGSMKNKSDACLVFIGQQRNSFSCRIEIYAASNAESPVQVELLEPTGCALHVPPRLRIRGHASQSGIILRTKPSLAEVKRVKVHKRSACQINS